ncbi:hypothetical protein PG990_013105 [Apiospora arundinis]
MDVRPLPTRHEEGFSGIGFVGEGTYYSDLEVAVGSGSPWLLIVRRYLVIAGTQKAEHFVSRSRGRKAASSAIWVLPMHPRPSITVHWHASESDFGGIISRMLHDRVTPDESFVPAQWHYEVTAL